MCISLHKPEATSLVRSMGFNKTVVMQFYGKLCNLLEKYTLGPENRYNLEKCKLEPESIYNFDKTRATSVQIPSKVLAKKVSKQIGLMINAERGELMY